jgi:hypothetical protein
MELLSTFIVLVCDYKENESMINSDGD